MKDLSFNEINKKLQWKDFHDSSLISFSFHFFEKNDFKYNSKIIIEIETLFKNNVDKPILLEFIFKKINNIEFNAFMNDKDFADSSTIYSFTKKDNYIELVSVPGWKLAFYSNEITINIEEESK